MIKIKAMIGKKIKNEDAIRFMFAGKSIVTFLNTKTENKFTYKITKSKDGDLFFVNVLKEVGDGEFAYSYIGIVANNVYKHGKKSNLRFDSQQVKVFSYVLERLNAGNLQDVIEVWHEGKCGKCGKPLTTPDSIDTGFGPTCFKTLSKVDKRDALLSKILS